MTPFWASNGLLLNFFAAMRYKLAMTTRQSATKFSAALTQPRG
jgi:hypothetical protein